MLTSDAWSLCFKDLSTDIFQREVKGETGLDKQKSGYYIVCLLWDPALGSLESRGENHVEEGQEGCASGLTSSERPALYLVS